MTNKITDLDNKKYVTLSFRDGDSEIFSSYEPYEFEFDCLEFTGFVSLTEGYDPDWHQSSNGNESDTSISFDWYTGNIQAHTTMITDLQNPDELCQVRQITDVHKMTDDLYIFSLNSK